MPKCLDCNNTKKFTYVETNYVLASYKEDGEFDDVEDNWYDDIVTGGKCAVCESKNVEGKL